MEQTRNERPNEIHTSNYKGKIENKDNKNNNNNIDSFNLKPRIKSCKSKSCKSKISCNEDSKKKCKTDALETDSVEYMDETHEGHDYGKIKYIQLLDKRKGRGAECQGIEIPSNLTFFKRFYGLEPKQKDDPFTDVNPCATNYCDYMDCAVVPEPIECACLNGFGPEAYFSGPVNNFNNHNEIQSGSGAPRDFIPMILCSIPKDKSEESSDEEEKCVKSKQDIEKHAHTIQEFRKYSCGPDDRGKIQRYPRYKFKSPYNEEPTKRIPACLEPLPKTSKNQPKKHKESLDGTFIFVPQECNEQKIQKSTNCGTPPQNDFGRETQQNSIYSQTICSPPQQPQMNSQFDSFSKTSPQQLCDVCQSHFSQNNHNELQLLKQIQHQINTYIQSLSSPNSVASCQDKINQIQRILKDPMYDSTQSGQNTCQNSSPQVEAPCSIQPPPRPPQPVPAQPCQAPPPQQPQVAKLIPVKLAKIPSSMKSDEPLGQVGYAQAYYLKPRKGAAECEFPNNGSR